MADIDRGLGDGGASVDLAPAVAHVSAVSDLSSVPVGRGEGTPAAVLTLVHKCAADVVKDRYRGYESSRGVGIFVVWDEQSQEYQLNLRTQRDDLTSSIGKDRAHAEVVFEYACKTVKGWPGSIDLHELNTACVAKIARTIRTKTK